MKILIYMDEEILTRIAGMALAVSEAMPIMCTPEMAAALKDAVVNCSVPLPDAVAEQIVREMWDELSRIHAPGPGLGDRSH